ncbi:XPB/Ssl2-like helicase family protein [Paenibacillus taihuensis]|uniref:XPB/Ssl2-like helicase family protein n=1 Tax=Paenibacillus taihuensis TaxID=1156355 RepID=A0A3D9SIK9_9BACL|nr:helicase-associated domain-containing protein [Paenibacillus taihuensis]REE88647.1 XPB/Ssl2-like helicase family protein [Paenibacillus taihuensis]
MKLVEIAGKLSEEQRLQIAEHAVWRGMAWPDSLLARACAREAWRRLEQPARYVLEVIMLGFGRALFSEEQLLQAAKPRLAGSELRIGLLQLQEAGIVFAVRRGWGERLYVFPSDMYSVWYREMLEEKRLPALPEIDAYDIVPIDGCEGYVPPLSGQLLHAMAALQNAGMKRTAKGVLTKRSIDAVGAQLFYDSEQLLCVTELTQSGVAQLYPLPLAIMLLLALQEGWLIEHKSAYLLDEAVWQAWQAQPAQVREAKLLQRVLELLCNNSAAASVSAAQLCAQSTAYTWYRAADVEEQLQHMSSNVLAKPLQSTIAAWSQLLRTLGWMEAAEDESGAAVFRWLIQPNVLEELDDADNGTHVEAEQRFMISCAALQFTPDGDIYVQEDSPYAVRWQLELIAERRRTDRITVYRMTERSYKRAAEQGMDSAMVIRVLESASAADEPLPETMRAAITIGMSAHGSALKPAANSTDSIDSTDPASTVSVTLHASNPNDNEPYLLGSINSINSSNSGQTYELIFERKAVRTLFAGIESVPAMWLKHFRTYHHSTRRELMEQALSWRSAVKLSCEGEIKPFIPERIVEEGGRWAVVGHLQEGENCLKVLLQPDMWQEMMLLLPEGTLYY